MKDYELRIISLDKKEREIKKHSLDDMDFIGVHENEPFEIHFKNNTWKAVQVKISVDGTDILTCEPASTDVSGQMWHVKGYETLKLRAWPEDNHGGSKFVFTDAKNGVALNTHGDVSSKGVIAAAVYVEKHEPIKINYNPPTYTSPYFILPYTITCDDAITYDITCNNTLGGHSYSSGILRSQNRRSKRNESINTAAVGAGEYTEQHVKSVSSFVQPELDNVLKVRYEWWNSLRSKLRKYSSNTEPTNGFPGDKKNYSLSNVPKVSSRKRARKHQEFQRLVA